MRHLASYLKTTIHDASSRRASIRCRRQPSANDIGDPRPCRPHSRETTCTTATTETCVFRTNGGHAMIKCFQYLRSMPQRVSKGLRWSPIAQNTASSPGSCYGVEASPLLLRGNQRHASQGASQDSLGFLGITVPKMPRPQP